MNIRSDVRLVDELLGELGVSPIVHGGGTKSSMGGSSVDPQTASVMQDALGMFFNMKQLLEAVGECTARLLGVDGAAIVSGAASGCVLGAAALRNSLPTARQANIITQRRHYGRYTYLYEQGGCDVREIGTMNDCPPAWYADAIDEDTVGIAWLEGPGIRSAGARLDEICAIAADRQIPVLVDAAAMVYPYSNIQSYLDAGADLVVISGGKLLGGPQASGFILGDKILTRRVQNLGFPHQGVGRAHKITKEVALGAYAAIRRLAAEGDQRFDQYAERAQWMVSALQHAGIPVRVEQNSRHQVPAVVAYEIRKRLGTAPSALSAKQLLKTVPIFFPYDDARDELYVEFASLEPSQDSLVLDRLLGMFRMEKKV